MIRFLLNDKVISAQASPGLQLLDLLRYRQNLKGTKIGCREGDCGACTVLVGSLENGRVHYRTMTSCLLPLANVEGKQVVTIEGLNFYDAGGEAPLNFIQQQMAEEGATQCGFCTPGFVVSLAGFCLDGNDTPKKARASIDGNICRCTGYHSILRASEKIAGLMQTRGKEGLLDFLTKQKVIPSHFLEAAGRLKELQSANAELWDDSGPFVGGGTDLYVQKPEELSVTRAHYLGTHPALRGITRENDRISLGGAVTVADLEASKAFNDAFPAFQQYKKLISSTPIRNMATVSGNFINASPIGDLSIFFLVLDTEIELLRPGGEAGRWLALKDLFRGYKQLDRKEDEYISTIRCAVPAAGDLFHFEKVSKRTHLDIASVNSAILLRMEGNRILEGRLSAGGVAPVPLLLKKTSASLEGAILSDGLAERLVTLAMEEISPISDARGSALYKRLLLSQLIRAHIYGFLDKINASP